jgi:hypothetical protein
MATLNQFWDLGEEDIICPSKNNLYNILNALILCNGQIHDSHSLEARNGKWEQPTRSCAIMLRISLPIGTEERFQELSGFKLSKPPKFGVSNEA